MSRILRLMSAGCCSLDLAIGDAWSGFLVSLIVVMQCMDIFGLNKALQPDPFDPPVRPWKLPLPHFFDNPREHVVKPEDWPPNKCIRTWVLNQLSWLHLRIQFLRPSVRPSRCPEKATAIFTVKVVETELAHL